MQLPDRDTLRPDLKAGAVSALLMLPQAVILAALAGLPPEVGLYASIIPVVVAALTSSSSHLLSGPNTALALMSFTTLSALATPGDNDYAKYAIVLALLTGIFQLALAASRLTHIFARIPAVINQGATVGVGIVIVLTQIPVVLGLISVPGESALAVSFTAATRWADANPWSVSIALVTLGVTVLFRRIPRLRRYPSLIAGLTAGFLAGVLIDVFVGAGEWNLDRVGTVHLHLLPLSLPWVDVSEFFIVKQLIVGAMSLAFVGLLQSVLIARSIGTISGEKVDIDREAASQGIANIVASVLSAMPVSGSFNRSQAHFDAGAKTRWAAVLSAAILLCLALALAPVFADMPVAAMSASLLVIGLDMVKLKTIVEFARSDRRGLATLATVVVGCITDGVMGGIIAGAVVHIVLYRPARAEIAIYPKQKRKPVTAPNRSGRFANGVARIYQAGR
jgi:SulP family sulfate permease